MTTYPKSSGEKTISEEASRRQVKEKKQQRAKQLAEVEARRKIIYRKFKRTYRLKASDDIERIF